MAAKPTRPSRLRRSQPEKWKKPPRPTPLRPPPRSRREPRLQPTRSNSHPPPRMRGYEEPAEWRVFLRPDMIDTSIVAGCRIRVRDAHDHEGESAAASCRHLSRGSTR